MSTAPPKWQRNRGSFTTKLVGKEGLKFVLQDPGPEHNLTIFRSMKTLRLPWRAYKRQIWGTLIVSLVGIFFLETLEIKLRSTSMDFLFALRHRFGLDPTDSLTGATIVHVDTTTIHDWKPFVQILTNLVSWGVKAVVFDIVFEADFWTQTNAVSEFGAAVTNAITNKVKVVFAAEGQESEN